MDFFVGTFNTKAIFSLRFNPPTPSQTAHDPKPKGTLRILAKHPAVGNHSWLCFHPSKLFLYATAWTDPPSIAAYRVTTVASTGFAKTIPHLELLNTANTASRSGYVCASTTHLYSAGGPSGEVFRINADGSIGDMIFKLSFRESTNESIPFPTGPDQQRQADQHGDFGGLRHGAHSIDLSPDGKTLHIADIGQNCVWSYWLASPEMEANGYQHLKLGAKNEPASGALGPRHCTFHPKGAVLYTLNEHSCDVDMGMLNPGDGVSLLPVQRMSTIPRGKDPKDFWADEVRVSTSGGLQPKYLYATTRGLKSETKGYVAVWRLDFRGTAMGQPVDIWETPTSGGLANAIEPGPAYGNKADIEWLALTDSEEGWVFILGFDGDKIWEEARCRLTEVYGEHQGAATAIWR